MKIEIRHRASGSILYECEADSLRAAVVKAVRLSRANLSSADLSGAYLSSADLSGAYLSSANLSGAYLSSANLSSADLSSADLSGAYLSSANLSGADLTGANLTGADLTGANLTGADLTGAIGIEPWRTTPLMMLLDQPGKIRAYKLVNSRFEGPFQGGVVYVVGESIDVPDASTDATAHCAAGINVATLDWCAREWKVGYRILIVEFEAKDIAAIPVCTEGKFRLHRCTVIGEKDLVSVGLVSATAEVAS